MRKALIVLNPSSADFQAQKRWPELEIELGRLLELTVVTTSPDPKTTSSLIAQALTTTFDRVIAIGGDGTVHLVVNEMLKAGPAPYPKLGVISFGTANDVAKSFDLHGLTLQQSAAVAAGETTRGLDVGHLTCWNRGVARSTCFIDSVTLGMDADVLASRAEHRDLPGYLSYVPAVVERAIEQHSFDVSITTDKGQYDDRVFNLVINNVPIYAGELVLPGSKAADGLLDLYVFDRMEYSSKVVSFLVKQADLLKLGFSDVLEQMTQNQRTEHTKTVQARLASPRKVQVDGEIFGEADGLRTEIVTTLQVLAPPGVAP